MRTTWQALKDTFSSVLALIRRGDDPQHQQNWVIPYNVAGLHLSPNDSLSLSTVWACIDIIAKNVASCRWNIYEPIPGTKKRRLLDEDWKTWMLNTRPNPEMTAIGFREALLFQAIPFGNAYAEIVFDLGGRARQMWPLLTDRVTPRRNRDTWELEYHVLRSDGTIDVLPQNRIFHLRGPGLWGLMGDNVIARAAKTLAVAAAAERFSASFFGQGAQPVGVLQMEGKLDEPTHARLKKDWNDKFKGPENAHKPIILEGGMKYNPISIDPQKSQLVEARKFSVEEICRWFGVPPHKVQHLEHATFSNIEHSSIEFTRDGLRPWSIRLCQEADAKLFDQNRGPWKYTEIDLSPLTRGDALSRAQAQASWRQNGIMTANEIRAQENLDDIGDDGDVLLVQANLTTVEKLLEAPAPGSQPQLPPGTGEDEEADDEKTDAEPEAEEDEAVQDVLRRAVRGAIQSSFDRYGRRLKNRTDALKNKSSEERSRQLAVFRSEQAEVILHEMGFFYELMVDLGCELTNEDVTNLMSMYERGEDVKNFVHALPR